jgi:hypothetical protein
MKVINPGNPTGFSFRQTFVYCRALLEVEGVDLYMRKWSDSDHRLYFVAVFKCPCCKNTNDVPDGQPVPFEVKTLRPISEWKE